MVGRAGEEEEEKGGREGKRGGIMLIYWENGDVWSEGREETIQVGCPRLGARKARGDRGAGDKSGRVVTVVTAN